MRQGGYLVADLARSFLDPDRNNPFMRGKRVPVTPLQIVSTVLLAVVYTSMILIAMVYLMGINWGPPHIGIVYLAVIAGTFLMSCCAAWHNVRLWCGQAEDYAAELKEVEEDERSRQPHFQAKRPQS